MEIIEKKTQSTNTEVNTNTKQADKENKNLSNNVQKISTKNNAKNDTKNNTKISQDTIIYTPIKDIKKQSVLSENKIETNKIQLNNENKKKEVNQPPKQSLIVEKRSKNKILKILMIMIILLLFSTIISTVFALIYMNNNKIVLGVTVNNINIANYSKQDAVDYLQNKLNSNNNYITVKSDNYEKNIYLSDINGKFNVEQAVNDAYNMGRNNKLIINNYNILATMLLKNNIICNFEYDEELLQKEIEKISTEIPGMALNCTYVIKDNKLIIKKRNIRIKNK